MGGIDEKTKLNEKSVFFEPRTKNMNDLNESFRSSGVSGNSVASDQVRPETSSVGYTSSICNSATKDPPIDRRKSIIKSTKPLGMMGGFTDLDSELRIP